MNKELLKLAIPNILSNLTIPLVSLVDIGLMGHMPSSDYIISIGFGVMIFNFVYWSFGFLRMGTTGIVSQAFGSNDYEKLLLILKQSLLIGIIGSVILILFQKYIFQLADYFIGSDAIVSGYMNQYFSIRIWAAPATILTYVFTGWFFGMQNSKSVLYLTLLINISNVFFSYLFVFIHNMDIEGVAIGTVIAQYLGLLFCLIYFRINYSNLVHNFFVNNKRLKVGMKNLLVLNGNIFIRTFSLIFVLSLFKIYAGNASSTIGAANILLLEFVTISAYGIDGFAFAAESLCGKYFGKRKVDSFKVAVKTSFIWGIVSALVFSITFYLFGDLILHSLTNKVEIINTAKDYLPWLILAPLINSIAFVWDGVYVGATASKLMRNTMLVSTIIYLITFQPLQVAFGNHGLWFALSIFMLSRGVFQTFFFKSRILSKLI